MPEGHTIHRLARLQRPLLVGRPVAVSSPQGRFAAGAGRLDGQEVEEVEAVGKHLFYHWTGDDILHVHLGLFGKFRTFRSEPPEPTEGTRLALRTDEATIYLAGPTACELLTAEQRAAIVARLGPDPLHRTNDGGAALAANLARRSLPIGAALLDQKVVAGIGNVYRAEIPVPGRDRPPSGGWGSDRRRDLQDLGADQARAPAGGEGRTDRHRGAERCRGRAPLRPRSHHPPLRLPAGRRAMPSL